MSDPVSVLRYTCTSCGLVVRVVGRAAGAEIVACGCRAPVDEAEESAAEPGA